MCHHRSRKNYDVYSHEINPDIPCRVVFSFGFYKRFNHHGLNPYGLIPIPSVNSYNGPYNFWTFGVNLRVKCNHGGALCNDNILLARDIHTHWHTSLIWETHPNYTIGKWDKGVDFIAEPNQNIFYIINNHANPLYRKIARWIIDGINDHGLDIDVIEVDDLPPDAFDLLQWILDRINDINNLPPFQDYLQDNNFDPIPFDIV